MNGPENLTMAARATTFEPGLPVQGGISTKGEWVAMASFEDRERGFENKFKHDQELGFKVAARRNKLVGLWAAQELKLPAAEHEAYAKSVVMADLEKPGDDDVVEKLLADFKAKGVSISEHRIRQQLSDLREVARKQVMSESK
jgi:hypothetical protein